MNSNRLPRNRLFSYSLPTLSSRVREIRSPGYTPGRTAPDRPAKSARESPAAPSTPWSRPEPAATPSRPTVPIRSPALRAPAAAAATAAAPSDRPPENACPSRTAGSRPPLAVGQQRVVIPRSPVIDGRPLVPLMPPLRQLHHHIKCRSHAEQQRQRRQRPEWNQDRQYGDHRNRALQQRTQPFQKFHRLMRGFHPRPMQMVIEIAGVIKRQVHLQRLLLNQPRKVVPDQLRLRRPHPRSQSAQQLPRQHHCAHPRRPHQHRADGVPFAAQEAGHHHPVHDGARQVHRGHRQKPLRHQQYAPHNRQPPASLAHQPKGARKMMQLLRQPLQSNARILQGLRHAPSLLHPLRRPPVATWIHARVSNLF